MLTRARHGDKDAEAELFPIVYGELRAIARSQVRKLRPGDTLQPTALVNEAYLRALGDVGSFDNRAHFFFVAARAMHDIVVESARRKARLRHGGDQVKVSPEEVEISVDAPGDDMVALSEALAKLEKAYPRAHQVVMLRFFAGLSGQEAAELMGIGERTAKRDWTFARVYLHDLLSA